MPDLLCQACSSPITRGILCPKCAQTLMVKVLADDPDCLKCENCGALYSASEARVQRRLKQIAAFDEQTLSGKLGESTTPMLCWVCSRLHHAAKADNEAWFTQ
jgi:DNA-directed RNA polymerase subunit M/transcription elongation factor TFIIS